MTEVPVNQAYRPPIKGINHMGLVVEDMGIAKEWFGGFLGFEKVHDRGGLAFYLVGDDILAIKTQEWAVNKPEHGGESFGEQQQGWQALDHYGFFAPTRGSVYEFAEKIREAGIEILKGPYDRSDGASVYLRDPCGMVCEYLFFQSGKLNSSSDK